MAPAGDHDRIDDALRGRVLQRLGLPQHLAPDQDSLRAVYAAWCLHVPFDNVRKMVALQAGDATLPGGHAADFFEHWLENGGGGTCWPSSNALFVLLSSLGFDARRVTGAMRDAGVENHGSVKVRVEGCDWLVDSSMLVNAPLPLDGHVFVNDNPLFPAEVEPADGTHIVWSWTPVNDHYLPCRLVGDPASHAGYLAAYEASRNRSPFNQRLYARRNHVGERRFLVGATRLVHGPAGVSATQLSPEGVCLALTEDIGLSPSLVRHWVRCGGLDASLAPPAGPTPPAPTRKPPSQR